MVEFNWLNSTAGSTEGIPLCPKDFVKVRIGLLTLQKAVHRGTLSAMGYVVAHCRKVDTVGLGAVIHHNTRQSIYDDEMRPLGELPEYITHPERVRLNEGNGVDSRAGYKRRADVINQAKLGRKPQKNAAAAVEFSISASPEFFKSRKPKEWKEYFSDVREFLGHKYGRENVLSWNVHCDETTPHMHLLMVPIITTEKGKKYSSSAFLGGRNGLRDLQTEIYESVGRKWGLERGIEGSTARHTNHVEWQKNKDLALSKKETELENNKKAFFESKKKQLRNWELPDAKLFESGKAYRERITLEVEGKIARTLFVVDNAEKAKNRAVEEAVARKEAKLKLMSDTCYRLDREGKESKRQAESANQKFQNLQRAIAESRTDEDFQRVKKAVLGQSQNQDRGLTR